MNPGFLVGDGFGTVVVVVVVAVVLFGTSFTTVVLVGVMTAVVVVAGLTGSAGLKRSNGLGIVIPGKMVIPDFVGVGLGIVIVLVAIAVVVVVGTPFMTDDVETSLTSVVGSSFAIVVVRISFAMAVVGISFVVVILVGATLAVVVAVVGLGGSTGLNRSSGFGIVMPGKMVHPEPLVGVGVGLSNVEVASSLGLEEDGGGESSLTVLCGRALVVVTEGSASLMLIEGTIGVGGIVPTTVGVEKTSETAVVTLSGARTVVMSWAVVVMLLPRLVLALGFLSEERSTVPSMIAPRRTGARMRSTIDTIVETTRLLKGEGLTGLEKKKRWRKLKKIPPEK